VLFDRRSRNRRIPPAGRCVAECGAIIRRSPGRTGQRRRGRCPRRPLGAFGGQSARRLCPQTGAGAGHGLGTRQRYRASDHRLSVLRSGRDTRQRSPLVCRNDLRPAVHDHDGAAAIRSATRGPAGMLERLRDLRLLQPARKNLGSSGRGVGGYPAGGIAITTIAEGPPAR
jgi:hypothetical protein